MTFWEEQARRQNMPLYPNPSRVCTFSDWHGEYQELGDPCVGDAAGTSFYGQFTCVLRVPGTDLYIAMADRWKPTAFGKWFSKRYYAMIEKAMSGGRHEEITKPDRSPKKAGSLPRKEMRHMENTSIARYVWLPVEWKDGKPLIRWQEEWRIEDYI